MDRNTSALQADRGIELLRLNHHHIPNLTVAKRRGLEDRPFIPRNTTTSHTRHSSYLLLLLLLLLLLFELVSISESGWWQVRTIIVTDATPERPTTARSNHGAVSRVVFAHWPRLFHETGRGVRG